MKVEIQKNRIYKYYCDRCGKEINFKDNTMKQVHIKYSERKTKKLCDLCNRCFKALERGVKKGKGGTNENT